MSLDAQRREVLSRVVLRRLLGEVLRTDSELNAFCIDHFPAVSERYSDNMDRLVKINLLLTAVPPEQIFAYLAAAYPTETADYERAIRAEVGQSRAGAGSGQFRAVRNRRHMLTKVRKFWIEGILESSLHGAPLIELGKEVCTGPLFERWHAVVYCAPPRSRPLPAGVRLLEIFDENLGELLLLGAPGGGKTTLLLDLCRDLLARAEQDAAMPIPVVLNLSTWGLEQRPIAEWISEELRLRYDVPNAVGSRWIESGQLLPLLDGLDELPAAMRPACVAALHHYREMASAPGLVVACREAAHAALPQPLQLPVAIRLHALSIEQITLYLDRIGISKEIFLAQFGNDPALHELTKSPLFLDILIRVLRSPARLPAAGSPPNERSQEIWGAYFRAAMLRRRSGQTRCPSPEATLRYLCGIARQLLDRNQAVFYMEDLQPDLLNSAVHRVLYRHGSHFVFALLLLLLSCTTLSSSTWGFYINIIPVWLWVMLGIFGIAASMILFDREYFTDQIIPRTSFRLSMDPLRTEWWSITKRATCKALKEAFLYSLVGAILVMFLTFDSNFLSQLGMRISFSPSLLGRLIYFCIQTVVYFISFILCWLPARIVFGFITGALHSDEVSDRRIPNQDILVTARRVLLLIGWTLGVILGGHLAASQVSMTRHNRLLYYAIEFLFLAIPSLLMLLSVHLGGLVVTRHYALRALLAVRGVLPMRLGGFLDAASERMLLRRVGGGYVFLHRLLAEYLAGLGTEDSRLLLQKLRTDD